MPEQFAGAAKETKDFDFRRKSRLTSADRESDLVPLRRAKELTRCSLYWIPASAFPLPKRQREWLIRFFDALQLRLFQKLSLRTETFLQFRTIHAGLTNLFLNTSREFHPLLGLSRRPGTSLPPLPSMADIQSIAEGRKKFEFGDYVGDYCYWFVHKKDQEERGAFFGNGGMTILFLSGGDGSQCVPLPILSGIRKSPAFQPLFSQINVDEMWKTMNSLMDAFLPKSKELFGAGLEDDPQFRGLLFILPLLGAGDFFTCRDEEIAKWFELFDVYINESPIDRGVVIASKPDIEDDIISIIEGMREEGWSYPES